MMSQASHTKTKVQINCTIGSHETRHKSDMSHARFENLQLPEIHGNRIEGNGKISMKITELPANFTNDAFVAPEQLWCF